MDYLKSFFQDELTTDDRQPLFEFTIPGSEGKFGLFAPGGLLWQQLVLTVALQIGVQCLLAAIIYKFIIGQRGTIQTYLLGWGVIFPFVIMFPYWLLETFDIRNKVVKLAAGTIFSIVGFRCIEAMYDCSPPIVESSLTNYMLYYTTACPFDWDKTTQTVRKVTQREVIGMLIKFYLHFTMLGLVLSFLMHFNFQPFESNVKFDEWNLTWDLLSPAHLANSYLIAVLTYFNLWVGFEGSALGQNAQGYATKPIFSNPLLTSTTPIDFWTKKWNTMIHLILKGGVFLPSQKFFHTKIAVFLTFLASGLFHDFIHTCVFYNHSSRFEKNGTCDGTCYFPMYGKLTAFFLYTGVIMLLQRPLGRIAPFQWMASNLPAPIKATLLVFIHLPVAHWYYGDWVAGGYFRNFAVGLWHFRKL